MGLSGREEYSNNGSPILINSNNMKMVETKLKQPNVIIRRDEFKYI